MPPSTTNYLLGTATTEDRQLSVFNGPDFAAGDPAHDGVPIPTRYWKVAAWVRPDGTMGAAGVLVSQEELLAAMGPEAAAEPVARAFQVRIHDLQQLTGLDFGRLRSADTFRHGAAPLETAGPGPAELSSLEQVQL